ncbi:ANTAR domain-containing protein [Mobilitalea sibirica]|uniref:ANTAR domain-containing protein n=1 Tax=Mobilitalea sibirica TaxID=1462919 RepID=A0A8J7L2G0_9FIRM|nr:ANTAR domain-containing protein [Mobilitalea sibirica]MBH1940523.1 ANTAR domain-containing protein [Mobilitalea sibirica]
MFSIIVGFPKYEDAASIKNVLVRNGYNVSEPCTLGAQIVTLANDLDEGIVVCGYRFSDMHYSELNNYLPKGFEMLLVASPQKLEYSQENIVCLRMPVKTHDLLNTLQMMTYQYQRRKKKEKDKPKTRTEEEKNTIEKAKLILMDRNNLTEEEAHRYLQKNSMDSGTNMVEMAEIVIRMFYS